MSGEPVALSLSYSEDELNKDKYLSDYIPEYKWQWLLVILVTEQDAKIQ
jgi:hypothetical protein